MKKIILLSLTLFSFNAQAGYWEDFSNWTSSHYKKAKRGMKSSVNYIKSFIAAPKERPIDIQLKQAVKKGDLAAVNKLLAEDINPNTPDKFRATALHYAAQGGSLDIIKALLNAGANINTPDYYGNTPLHRTNTINTAKILIENGADLSIRNSSNKTGEEHALSLKDARGKPSTVLAEIIKRVKANKPALRDEL